MELQVLVEPGPAGFRAITGPPLDFTVDAPTADAAMAGIRERFAAWRAAGGEVRVIPLPTPLTPEPPTRPGTNVARLEALAAKIGQNPLFEDYVAAIEEYRREHNTIHDEG